MIKIRTTIDKYKHKRYQPWTIYQLIVDLADSGMSTEAVSAYLRGLEIDNKIKLPKKATKAEIEKHYTQIIKESSYE